jgi:hypothetical protein
MDPNAIVLLLEVLIGGAAKILEAQKNKSAQAAGVDIELANQVALSVLQTVAEVKGLKIDWSDPAQVGSFIGTLPVFVPISDPTPPTGA